MTTEIGHQSSGVYAAYSGSNGGSTGPIEERMYGSGNEETEEVIEGEEVELNGNSRASRKLTASASGEAWFVPDPDEEPPVEEEPLHTVMPSSLKVSLSNSTLPTSHALGVRAPSSYVASATPLSSSPSSSAWGSTMADAESVGHLSTLSTSPPEQGRSGVARFAGVGALSASGGWAAAMPHDLLSSPRGHFSSGELDPLSSPRVSAHRVAHLQAQEHLSSSAATFGAHSPSFSPLASSSPRIALPSSFPSSPASSYGTPSSSSSITVPKQAQPPLPSPSSSASSSTPIQLTHRSPMARDSFETNDGSSSHVSGTHSQTSRLTAHTEGPDLNLDEESESSYDHLKSGAHARFTAAQQNEILIGSVPTTSSLSMTSPRSMTDGQNQTGSGSLKTSSDRPVNNSTAPRHGTMRPPRTKSVALNPMLVTRNSSTIINNASASMNSSSGAVNAPVSGVSMPPVASSQSISSQSDSNPLSPRNGDPTTTTPKTNSTDSIDARRGSSLHLLQSIPAPIAAALNLVPEAPEMRIGGDTHVLQWAWDMRKKHPFLKVSSDHSSISWSSSTNYGLSRGNSPLKHRKTFIELAKTRGVSQFLQIGLARGPLDWNGSPEKMQFNSVKIPGEWTAVWVKSSTTGDRFGVLFDLDDHKMTLYRNGVVTNTHILPSSFTVKERVSSNEDSADGPSVSSSSETSAATTTSSLSSSPSTTTTTTTLITTAASSSTTKAATEEVEEKDLIYPFVGVCGDQDILITEMPEFEKYTDIVWSHDKIPQLSASSESLEGIPAILEVLGLQKLRPKFEGMPLSSFQKLKDADLRKMGATTEQRRRLLSQIETMK